jgi:hypothetical protein
MASNNDLTDSENILVKVDQNNLIYIDPNSVVDNDGIIQPRGFKQENLVMYANLEADLIPRTSLVARDQGTTLTSIAKGELNFLKNQTGDGNFDTSWTDSFLGKPELNTANDIKTEVTDDFFLSDPSGQTFGIDGINIIVKGANFTPQVTINFIDVRGKTLFESSENSPYRAFFHIPWPIFYLTVKGYYGKAIRYTIPLFIPSATEVSVLLSRTALHIAHWADDELTDNRVMSAKTSLVRIVWRDHEVNYYTRYSYI